MRRAVGMAWQRRAGTQSLQNKAAAGGHSRRTTRPAQALKQQQPAVGRPRSKTTAADDVGRPLAVQCRLVEGVQWCWPLRRRAQTYLPTCLPPTYRLWLSLSLPTPLIYKTQFSPNLFFCCFYFFHLSLYFPTINRPRTPFIVFVRLTYRVG